MASITERCGSFQAHVRRNGVRKTKTFKSRIQAEEWAGLQELTLGGITPGKGEAFEAYSREVDKRGRPNWPPR